MAVAVLLKFSGTTVRDERNQGIVHLQSVSPSRQAGIKENGRPFNKE